MKKTICFILLLLLLNQDAYTLSYTRKLRIISLAPSATEILFALGLDEEIVGVSSFCNYPLKAKEKQRVGTFSQPNIEEILFLKPDIIFCTGLEQTYVVKQLKELGLNVCVSDPSNIEELLVSIRQIGKLTQKEKEANMLVKNIELNIEKMNSRNRLTAQENKPKVFVEIWHDPLITAGNKSFINELILLAGGVNIANGLKRAYGYFSVEQIIKYNPDCIILTYMTKEKPLNLVKERLGWKNISAVKNNRIYNDIAPDLLLRPSPRIIDGLKELHKRLYPE